MSRSADLPSAAVADAVPRLHRDPLTLVLYTAFGAWGWFLFGFGPTTALLRAEQGTSRSVAGLHGTAMAAGSVVSALVAVPLARRCGRRAVALAGMGVLVVGALLVVSGLGLAATMPGAFVAGLGGLMTINASSPALAEHHGTGGGAALTEANAVCTALGVLSPVVLGALAATAVGWRGATLLTLPLVLVAWVVLRRLPAEPALGRAPAAPAGRRPPLGRRFWAVWGVLVCGVAVEFATIFWAGDLLTTRLGVSVSAGAASVGAFVLGMTLGRLVGGRLALVLPLPRLLAGSLLVAAAGWALLWTATHPVVAVLGLAACGLGVALLFPLTLALLIDSSSGRPDTATAVGSVGASAASGVAPFALGALGDWVGPHQGFLLLPALFAVALALLVASGALRPGALSRH